MLRHMCNQHLNKSVWLQQQFQQRCCYHSEKGVFGYRPRTKREYKGNVFLQFFNESRKDFFPFELCIWIFIKEKSKNVLNCHKY